MCRGRKLLCTPCLLHTSTRTCSTNPFPRNLFIITDFQLTSLACVKLRFRDLPVKHFLWQTAPYQIGPSCFLHESGFFLYVWAGYHPKCEQFRHAAKDPMGLLPSFPVFHCLRDDRRRYTIPTSYYICLFFIYIYPLIVPIVMTTTDITMSLEQLGHIGSFHNRRFLA